MPKWTLLVAAFVITPILFAWVMVKAHGGHSQKRSSQPKLTVVETDHRRTGTDDPA